MNFLRFNAAVEPALAAYADAINAAAVASGVPAYFIAAEIMRESGGQNILQIGVAPGPGCGVGPCQITYAVQWDDIANPTFVGASGTVYHLMDPAQNIMCAAVEFMKPLIAQMEALRDRLPANFGTICRGQILFAVAGGYNAGYQEVHDAVVNCTPVDDGTTNGYATDVFRRYLNYCTAAAKLC